MTHLSMQPAIHVSIPLDQRSPRRITITVPYRIHQALHARSEHEGRSLSNLAAYLLERAVGSRMDPAAEPCDPPGSPRRRLW